MTDSTATGPSPEEQLASLRSEWTSLADKVSLGGVLDRLEDMDGEIGDLKQAIADVRADGYLFDRGWEEKADKLQSRWPDQKREAQRILNEQTQTLRNSARDVERLFERADRNHNLIDDLDRQLDALEDQISRAEQNVRGAFDRTEQELADIDKGLEWAKFMLDALGAATFKLYPEENGVAACKAQWMGGREEPEGVLFLTDARIIFEQKEEKATKKVLFITTAKELVQKKLWEAPVGAIEETSAEDKGGVLGFGVKEMLTLRFDTRVRDVPKEATLRFKDYADNEMWQDLIRRVKSGQIAAERCDAAPAAEPAAAAPAAEASDASLPTACTACGAKLPTIFKGMQQVECGYCGAVIHL